MSDALWSRCLDRLSFHFSDEQLNTWLRPLQASVNGQTLTLEAPNRYALRWLEEHAMTAMHQALKDEAPDASLVVQEYVDTTPMAAPTRADLAPKPLGSKLNPHFTFEHFVQGGSNEVARAAAWQVSENPGTAYNPLFIYGDVGLGKTHIMQAVANAILVNKPDAHIAYVHSERYVGDLVRALQHNTINDFKQAYRAVDVLLVDDIQFFVGKERFQEEFFYNFNTLLELNKQIVLTCDRYPKDLDGLEARLKSRFECGLTVCVNPPELETRVAIIKNKALEAGLALPDEVAFFVAKRVRSNVRELEGALKRIMANARFTGRAIDVEFAQDTLKDLLASQQRLVTMENIKRLVADYFNIRVADLLSKRRTRSVTRPRQVAMSLSKELTTHSLPEIGDAFGGRDHTTVIHACKTIKNLRTTDAKMEEDYRNLLRTVSA